MTKYVCVLAVILMSHVALAQDLALQVARVSTNEGAFVDRYETALVWQVTRNIASTNDKRLAWLLRHSPRVGGTRVCKQGNCFWTPNLGRDGAQPAGLVLSDAGFWGARLAPIWRDVLAFSDHLTSTETNAYDPCPVTPTTWGSQQDLAGALGRGLFPIGCRGRSRMRKLDDGFAPAKNCWRGPAGWGCDPAYEPAISSEPSVLEEAVATAARRL